MRSEPYLVFEIQIEFTLSKETIVFWSELNSIFYILVQLVDGGGVGGVRVGD